MSHKKKKNWVVFSVIPLAGSHKNHFTVYVSEMENPSLICSSPSQPSLSLYTLLRTTLPPSPVTTQEKRLLSDMKVQQGKHCAGEWAETEDFK